MVVPTELGSPCVIEPQRRLQSVRILRVARTLKALWIRFGSGLPDSRHTAHCRDPALTCLPSSSPAASPRRRRASGSRARRRRSSRRHADVGGGVSLPAGALRWRRRADAGPCRQGRHRRRAKPQSGRQRRGWLRQHGRGLRAQPRRDLHQHAGRAHRCCRGFHLGPDPRRDTPAERRRSADPRAATGPAGRSSS